MEESQIKLGRTGYYWLNSWVMASIIHLATQDFCRRFLNRTNDPCGRQYDQMTQAARSGLANIVEGNLRHDTSKETEMKLTDVARASIAELMSDYFHWILQQGEVPWSVQDEELKCINRLSLDAPQYRDDVIHESGIHILQQKAKYDAWIASDNSIVAANALVVLCNRLIQMINKQLEMQLTQFKAEGGFAENLTAVRLSAKREEAIKADAPSCPICGKPMVKRVAKRGVNSGKEFWSCSEYPNCNGTRRV